MSAKLLTVFIMLTSIQSLVGQESKHEVFERYFTWNPDSTSIYAEPNLESTKLVKLAYGTEVQRLEELDEPKVNIFIGELDATAEHPEKLGGYALPTSWIKIKFRNITGFALNAEVINLPPMKYLYDTYSFERTYLDRFYQQNVKDTTYSEQWENSEFYFEIEETHLPDGTIIAYKRLEGCTDRQIILTNKSMAQAYFILKTWHFKPFNEYMSEGAQNLIYLGNENEALQFRAPVLSDFHSPFIAIDGAETLKIGSSFCD